MDEDRPESGGDASPTRPPRGDASSVLALAAAIVGVALVGGTSVAALVILYASAPAPAAPNPAPVVEPLAVPDVQAGEAARRELDEARRRLFDLEIEVLRLRERVRDLDTPALERLADRLLSGDPEDAKAARGVLALKGGPLGEVLADRLLELRRQRVELEAAAELEREKAEVAMRALVDERARWREEAGKRDRSRGQELYEFALKAQESGHAELAEQYYTQALELESPFPGARNGRGLVRLALARPLEALTDFTVAATLQPEYAPFHFNRGRALAALERHREAAEAFDRVLQLEPGNARALAARDEARSRIPR